MTMTQAKPESAVPNQHYLPIRNTACALMSDRGYLLIQASFQALQLNSWGFALIKFAFVRSKA